MDTAVLRLLFVSDTFEFNKVRAFLFLKHIELLFNSLLFVVKKFLLKLVYFFLFILVDVVEFALFEVVFTVLIDQG